jgi:CubicO group peptidase (beta-lactamase class C family)
MIHCWFWISVFLFSGIICCNPVDYNVCGTTANGWGFVRDLFIKNFEQERDLGASMAIYHQGKLVVNLWGGWFDESRIKPYDNDALQLVFSTSKGLVAVAVALCVQRGLLDYSALVTKYWPEYGQNGKENTKVADILSHRAGLPLVSSEVEQYLTWMNWTAMIHTLEQEKPLWQPGTAHGYHSMTYGWLAGELVRRVDPKKRSLGQFIQDEIMNPIQIEFYIGLPSKHRHRVSPVHYNERSKQNQSESMMTLLNAYNGYEMQQAEIPAANGITNAWSVARLYASLIGDIDDTKQKRLLDKEILKQAIKSYTPENEMDSISHSTSSFGMGFLLYDRTFTSLEPDKFGHNGKILC